MKISNDSSVFDVVLCLLILATVVTTFYISYHKYVVNRNYTYQVIRSCVSESGCESDKVYEIDAVEYSNNYKSDLID